MKPKRYILYLRISTAEQNSDLQRRELVEYANRRGWTYEILEDKASGTHANRPALQKLLQLARSRKIDGIAVWKCDRLFRSLKHAVVTLAELTELGVEFYSHKDQIDLSTSTGRLMANMLMAFAEFEADLIKSRVVSGLQAAKARGVQLGRPKIVNDEVIRQVLDLRFNRKLSIRQISEALAHKVSKTSIERILRDNDPSKPTLKKSV
ncbi:MAG: recombinase family protein [Pseudomonadota bacterium]|nr:recombinase family protein [Pseudomonadota bacterium]